MSDREGLSVSDHGKSFAIMRPVGSRGDVTSWAPNLCPAGAASGPLVDANAVEPVWHAVDVYSEHGPGAAGLLPVRPAQPMVEIARAGAGGEYLGAARIDQIRCWDWLQDRTSACPPPPASPPNPPGRSVRSCATWKTPAC
jgi:hypothetical protein